VPPSDWCRPVPCPNERGASVVAAGKEADSTTAPGRGGSIRGIVADVERVRGLAMHAPTSAACRLGVEDLPWGGGTAICCGDGVDGGCGVKAEAAVWAAVAAVGVVVQAAPPVGTAERACSCFMRCDSKSSRMALNWSS